MAHSRDVIGLGGMGSAAAYHLAARGHQVLGLERFGLAHNRGASHGGSRIIRQSYFEDPAYVPLFLRSYDLFAKLERDTGRTIATLCGGLMVGRPASLAVSGSLRSARHPEHPDAVTVACGFSGHGFKFVPVIGEIIADLALTGATKHPIALFDPRREALKAPHRLFATPEGDITS